MDHTLCKLLVPHEYSNYLMKHGLRQNTQLSPDANTLEQVNRANLSHRALSVKRQILSAQRGQTASSNVVQLGLTQVVGQAHSGNAKSTVISERPVSVKVSLVKDVQGQVRRDAQEQKEAFYGQWMLERVLAMIDVGALTQTMPLSLYTPYICQLAASTQELSLSFNILVDDGNLPCALTHSALDLLTQLSLSTSPSFTVMLLKPQSGPLALDPTWEEMQLSNNLLTITCNSSGKQHIEKSLALRTFATGGNNIQPLEQKPQSIHKYFVRFIILRVNLIWMQIIAFYIQSVNIAD